MPGSALIRGMSSEWVRPARQVFPFPQQLSTGKWFYQERMGEYIAFVRTEARLG